LKKVIVVMSLISAAAVTGAYQLYQFVPTPIPTVVIGEKQEKILGNSIAIVLPTNIATKQAKLLSIAYKVAKGEGFKNPEIVQGILLQETYAGGMKKYKVANPGPDAYFGPMQIKLGAARDILALNPQLYAKYDFHTRTDDEVKANLILNDNFNIEVAAKYIRLLQTQYHLSGRELVNAYNRGPTGVKSVDSNSFHYAIGAEQKLAEMKRKKIIASR
jgi:hypothetical protein